MAGLKRAFSTAASQGGGRSFKRQRKQVAKLTGTTGTRGLSFRGARGRFGPGRVGNADSPFPTLLMTHLSYCDVGVTRTSTAGAFSSPYRFRLHSLFDPNETGTGHQPRYYDTLLGANGSNAPYRQYCVYGAKWAVRAYSAESLTVPMRVAAGVVTAPSTSGGTDPGSMYECVERPEFQLKYITPVTGMKAFAEFSGYADLAKLWGKTRAELLSDDNFWADHTTHPALGAHLDLFCETSTAATNTVTFDVNITYYCALRTKTDVIDS